MKDELIKLIITAVNESAAAEGIPLTQPVDAATQLFGKDGLLDSMALVSLVIAVEQQIADKYGKGVALADEKALSQRSSPYRTVETLADYALTQLA
jgi:acyl carrier protein